MKTTFAGPWHIDIRGDLRPSYFDENMSSSMEGIVKDDPVNALNFAWRQGYAKGLADGKSNYIVTVSKEINKERL
jgi:hypothetical protein